MSKELDDLLRDVFGNGRGRTLSTQKAETYLQQSRKVSRGLDALEKQQETVNQRLQNQLEELKKMSGELDFDTIQKEVEKDLDGYLTCLKKLMAPLIYSAKNPEGIILNIPIKPIIKTRNVTTVLFDLSTKYLVPSIKPFLVLSKALSNFFNDTSHP